MFGLFVEGQRPRQGDHARHRVHGERGLGLGQAEVDFAVDPTIGIFGMDLTNALEEDNHTNE